MTEPAAKKERVISEKASELARYCELALGPVVRECFRAGVGIGPFLLIAKREFARAAVSDIEAVGQRPTLSRISAATGIGRKDLKLLLQVAQDVSPSVGLEPHDLPPTVRLVHRWATDPIFQNERGHPRPLSLTDGDGTFFHLVRETAGDISPVAMLRELETVGDVQRTASKTVRLVRTNPTNRYQHESMKEFGLRVSEFACSLSSGLSGKSDALLSATKIVSDLDEALVSLFVRTFSARAVGLLDGAEQWRGAQKGISGRKKGKSIGIGVYLFEPSKDQKVGVATNDFSKRVRRKKGEKI